MTISQIKISNLNDRLNVNRILWVKILIVGLMIANEIFHWGLCFRESIILFCNKMNGLLFVSGVHFHITFDHVVVKFLKFLSEGLQLSILNRGNRLFMTFRVIFETFVQLFIQKRWVWLCIEKTRRTNYWSIWLLIAVLAYRFWVVLTEWNLLYSHSNCLLLIPR